MATDPPITVVYTGTDLQAKVAALTAERDRARDRTRRAAALATLRMEAVGRLERERDALLADAREADETIGTYGATATHLASVAAERDALQAELAVMRRYAGKHAESSMRIIGQRDAAQAHVTTLLEAIAAVTVALPLTRPGSALQAMYDTANRVASATGYTGGLE